MRKLAVVSFLGCFMLIAFAGVAAAHDPFAPPVGGTGSSSSISGGAGPFQPGGAQGSSTATNGSTSSSSSSTSSGSGSTSSGSKTTQGSGQTSTGGHATGTSSSTQNLPFTGHDPKPWFVIAYGLIALGGSAIAFGKLSVV